MQLDCTLVPEDDNTRTRLVARLQAIGQSPTVDENGVVTLSYEGSCSGTPLAIITVFESFGCDRAIVFKDWGEDERPDEAPKTMLKINLESPKA